MISRYLQILDVFKSAGGPLTASEVARRTSIPMATAHRLVAELVGNSVLIKDIDGRLSMGIRLWEITAMSSAVRILREAALPHMQWVMAKTHYPILLSALDGHDVVNVETLTPSAPTPLNVTRPGVRLPVLASSSGIVSLAFGGAGDAVTRIVSEAQLTRFTEYTPMDRTQIRKIIETTRSSGHIVVRRWMWPKSGAVAVPVFGGETTAIGALSATIPWNASDVDEVAHVLKMASRAISAGIKNLNEPTDPYFSALSAQLKRVTG